MNAKLLLMITISAGSFSYGSLADTADELISKVYRQGNAYLFPEWTKPLSEEDQRFVESICEKTGVKVPCHFYVLPSGLRWQHYGDFGYARNLYLNQKQLEQKTGAAAYVVAHELMHAEKHHTLQRTLVILFLAVFMHLLIGEIDTVAGQLHILAAVYDQIPQLFRYCLFAYVCEAVKRIGLAGFYRTQEFEADREAVACLQKTYSAETVWTAMRQRLSEHLDHPVHASVYADHPSLRARLKAVGVTKAISEKAALEFSELVTAHMKEWIRERAVRHRSPENPKMPAKLCSAAYLASVDEDVAKAQSGGLKLFGEKLIRKMLVGPEDGASKATLSDAEVIALDRVQTIVLKERFKVRLDDLKKILEGNSYPEDLIAK